MSLGNVGHLGQRCPLAGCSAVVERVDPDNERNVICARGHYLINANQGPVHGVQRIGPNQVERSEDSIKVERADGGASCPGCGKPYRDHPMDKGNVSGIDGEPYLHIACDGTRIKT